MDPLDDILARRADAQLAGRYWLTAKAARYLGHPVPPHLPDDQAVVVLHAKETT